MIGKIINYQIDNNIIIINFENETLNVNFINEDIVRFFINYMNDDYSFAIKNINISGANRPLHYLIQFHPDVVFQQQH